MLDRIIRFPCELPILFSNNLLRRRRYGPRIICFAGKPAPLNTAGTTQRWGWTAKRSQTCAGCKSYANLSRKLWVFTGTGSFGPPGCLRFRCTARVWERRIEGGCVRETPRR